MNFKTLSKVAAIASLTVGLLQATPHKLDMPHTDVGFSVKHLMITNVKGKFNDFDAKIDFDYKTKQFKSFSAVIKTASVNTENEKRDKHLRSADFFNADVNPEMKFVMKSYKGDTEEGVMSGDLTIKGITHRVELEVEIGGTIKDFKGINRVGFVLSGKIDRSDFGLTWNKTLEAGGFVVGPKVKLNVEVEAIEL